MTIVKATLVERGPDATDDEVSEVMTMSDAVMGALAGIFAERGKAGKEINLDAILNALGNVMAHFLAGIEDRDERDARFQRFGGQLFDMTEICVSLGARAQMYSGEDFKQ